MPSRGSLLLFFSASVAAAAMVACSGAEATKKVPLTICEDGDEDCTKAKDNRPKNGSTDAPPGPTGTPVPGGDDSKGDEETADAGSLPSSDAGSDAGALGASCVALDKCCAQLVSQGYDPATCKSVVSTKNEAACFAQHDRYKTFGDCS